MPQPRRPIAALDSAQLERVALRYVERYATTRQKLRDYLARKLRERGWAGEGPADPAALVDRLAALGYIDDRGFAEARAAAMGRRGLGARRVAGALRQAGIDAADGEAIQPAIEARAVATALAFARRRRIGPYAIAPVDRLAIARALAAMLRAGHGYDLARRIVAVPPDEREAFEAAIATDNGTER